MFSVIFNLSVFIVFFGLLWIVSNIVFVLSVVSEFIFS